MSKKHVVFLMLAVFGRQLLSAQTKTDSSFRELDKVVITATRFPVKQSQTGKVVIVISHEELEKSTGKTLGMLLNEQAGVVVNGALSTPGTNQSVYIRGAASGRTLITIDGVPVNDPSQPDNGFDINLLPVSMIERIEISKGAQSTLYGSDAIAGVVNIITVKPEIKSPFNAKASASGGSYGNYNGSAQVYGKLADQLVYHVRYTHSHIDAWSTAADTAGHTGSGKYDNDGNHGDAVAMNVSWNPMEPLTVKGFLQYSHYLHDIDNGPFLDAKTYTSGSKNFMAGGGFTYKLPNTTINGNYLYNEANRDMHRDISEGYVKDNYFGKTQYAELFATTALGGGFTLLNGADYRVASMVENGVYGSYPSTFKDTSVSQTSMYSSLSYTSAFGLNVELGGRLNTHSRYGSNYTYTFNPAFLIDKNWKIYGSVASGFKAPSLYQLYGSYVGNPDLQPETSTTYEGGVQFSNRMLNSRATFFHRKTKNGLDYNYFTSQYFNFTGEKADGIEFESRVQFSRMISVTANYTWTKIKAQSQSHVTYADTTYSYSLRRPAHVINVTLGIAPVKNLLINISGHYESKRYDVGGYDAFYNPLPDVTMKQFLIFNAYAEYRVCKGLKLFADAKNIFNTRFTTVYGYNAIPALFNGGASIEF